MLTSLHNIPDLKFLEKNETMTRTVSKMGGAPECTVFSVRVTISHLKHMHARTYTLSCQSFLCDLPPYNNTWDNNGGGRDTK